MVIVRIKFSHTVLVCLVVCLRGVHLFFLHVQFSSSHVFIYLLNHCSLSNSPAHGMCLCYCLLLCWHHRKSVVIFCTIMHALLSYLRLLCYYFRILTNCPRQSYVFLLDLLATVRVFITLPRVARTSYWNHLHLIRTFVLYICLVFPVFVARLYWLFSSVVPALFLLFSLRALSQCLSVCSCLFS